jgi:hypothetical protein
MATLIIHTEGEKLKVLKKLLKVMGIKFETKKEVKSPYNPEFVKMVLEADARGDYKIIDPDNLWESIK